MPVSYRSAQSLIKRGDRDALAKALDDGLAPGLANANGWTLLMLAAVEGSISLGEVLLAAGADPTPRNVRGETAYSIAAARNHLDFLQLLPKPQPSTYGS